MTFVEPVLLTGALVMLETLEERHHDALVDDAQSTHRTGTNTESKLLLLGHAFERLDCIAVELRTHWLNHQSRQAIERLGAKQDGVLRSHRIMPDGTLRDTVVYSILGHEWPAIGNELKRRLALYQQLGC